MQRWKIETNIKVRRADGTELKSVLVSLLMVSLFSYFSAWASISKMHARTHTHMRSQLFSLLEFAQTHVH